MKLFQGFALQFLLILGQEVFSNNDFVKRSNSKLVRIMGGRDAVRNSAPWMVILRIESVIPICGAVILNENWLLTAAHCIWIKQPEDFKAFAGEHDLLVDEGVRQERSVDRLTPHPNFDYDKNLNDIGLVHVSEPFIFNSIIHEIDPPSADAALNDEATVFGWGRQISHTSRRLTTVLQELPVSIVEHKKCFKLYGKTFINEKTHICATAFAIGKSTCYGDSGGPLVQDGLLIGIVSMGERPCGKSLRPMIFTRVSTQLDWIRTSMD